MLSKKEVQKLAYRIVHSGDTGFVVVDVISMKCDAEKIQIKMEKFIDVVQAEIYSEWFSKTEEMNKYLKEIK